MESCVICLVIASVVVVALLCFLYLVEPRTLAPTAAPTSTPTEASCGDRMGKGFGGLCHTDSVERAALVNTPVGVVVDHDREHDGSR